MATVVPRSLRSYPRDLRVVFPAGFFTVISLLAAQLSLALQAQPPQAPGAPQNPPQFWGPICFLKNRRTLSLPTVTSAYKYEWTDQELQKVQLHMTQVTGYVEINTTSWSKNDESNGRTPSPKKSYGYFYLVYPDPDYYLRQGVRRAFYPEDCLDSPVKNYSDLFYALKTAQGKSLTDSKAYNKYFKTNPVYGLPIASVTHDNDADLKARKFADPIDKNFPVNANFYDIEVQKFDVTSADAGKWVFIVVLVSVVLSTLFVLILLVQFWPATSSTTSAPATNGINGAQQQTRDNDPAAGAPQQSCEAEIALWDEAAADTTHNAELASPTIVPNVATEEVLVQGEAITSPAANSTTRYDSDDRESSRAASKEAGEVLSTALVENKPAVDVPHPSRLARDKDKYYAGGEMNQGLLAAAGHHHQNEPQQQEPRGTPPRAPEALLTRGGTNVSLGAASSAVGKAHIPPLSDAEDLDFVQTNRNGTRRADLDFVQNGRQYHHLVGGMRD
ncbi:unnamed protein product [Amoebophrya sp. A120]|nr:unnamed protein product [Amoebophrya sp. A120]|eukprot:GSA120T00021415001.1